MKFSNISSMNWGPLTRQEQDKFQQLLAKMNGMSGIKPASKRVQGKTISEFAGREITSWKSTDFLYKKEPCPLPTMARGLFTGMNAGEERILNRGYDKFFNINEVSKTKWEWIEANTHGPYELTVKEDGCLIMASGMDNGKTLLVTSKHAVNVPHAEMGRKWMERHLSQAGKSAEDLAMFLLENNATAVFELCDDDFEEHILEYTERMRGLYLHGINRNAVELDTWPSAEVAKVAEYFGFYSVQRFEFDNIKDGRELADKVRIDQMLDGRTIEGFVIRCKLNGSNKPYMFKIKYDIPYLMFREWREVTNRILGRKPYRTVYPLTKDYAAWVKQAWQANPAEFIGFSNSQKGMFTIRKRFLEFYEKYGDNKQQLYDEISQMTGKTKVLLMPVGTIGCGKTTLSLALSRIFGFGHVQSDNFGSKRGNVFNMSVLQEFDRNSFVIADRSNHISSLRKNLTYTIQNELVNCRIIALQWVHEDSQQQEVLDKNYERVILRGDNHQVTIPKRMPMLYKVMKGFLSASKPLDLESESDCLVEDIIELDSLADTKSNLYKVIKYLCDIFPDMLNQPSSNEIDEALKYALAYVPEPVNVEEKSKPNKPSFFALYPEDIQPKLKSLVDKDMGSSHNYRIILTNAQTKLKHKMLLKGYIELSTKGSLFESIKVDCFADYIVSNGDNVALRVKTLTIGDKDNSIPNRIIASKGPNGDIQIKSGIAVPHIIVQKAKGEDDESIEQVLEQVFGLENANTPQNCPVGWSVSPVDVKFSATFGRW
ncbi:trna ligase [Coemansia brasiliensis]|uniref:Trna ligase n=1 Tax=Coemansia brasiliensis TaxID=2650707 RepID=A0A9W8I9K3_9FUNG|nr:trna ligase [Coemansia brasiliensis]